MSKIQNLYTNNQLKIVTKTTKTVRKTHLLFNQL